jgi:hypothetical protein
VKEFERSTPICIFHDLALAPDGSAFPTCEPRNEVKLGFVQGLKNKIRVIQWRAYGYRDEEDFRLTMLTAFLSRKCAGFTHTNLH